MLKTYFGQAFSLFFILGFIFIPITFYGSGYQFELTTFVFFKPVAFIQNHFFAYAIKRIDFSSDTIALNILLSLLLSGACILILLCKLLRLKSFKIIPYFKCLSVYYIAAVFLKYGFDKIFKQQFYLPEPNILYSAFGSLTKDILYWSITGASHLYSVVTGSVEVLTAVLILIKPTRVFGFCISVIVLVNIVLINFSFDISVKTFTIFLLAVVLLNVWPYCKIIYAFFVQGKQVRLCTKPEPELRFNQWTGLFLSAGLICYSLFPYLLAGNFNDDNAERPLLHGAYHIERFIIGIDTLNKDNFPYQRFFVHRNNYLIFQQEDGQMVDYFFKIDPLKKQLELSDYQNKKIIVTYQYTEQTGALKLTFTNGQKWIIEAGALNWKALPALQDKTHYTIDEIK